MSKKRRNNQNIWQVIVKITIIICILIGGYITSNIENTNSDTENIAQNENIIIDLGAIPEYTSSPYVEIKQ